MMWTRLNISIGILIVFHLVGIGGILLGDPEEFLKLTPLNLLLTLLLVLFNHLDWKKAWIFIVTYVVGFFIEVVGVNTGFPFGIYAYGSVLGPKWLDTPWLIGVNWLILLYGSNAIAKRIAMTAWARALIAAGLMVLLDYLIEPVAIQYDFWTWKGGSPPFVNYVGWFATAAGLSVLWQYADIRLNTRMAYAVYAVELAFFGIVNLIP